VRQLVFNESLQLTETLFVIGIMFEQIQSLKSKNRSIIRSSLAAGVWKLTRCDLVSSARYAMAVPFAV